MKNINRQGEGVGAGLVAEALDAAGVADMLPQFERSGAVWFSIAEACASIAQPVGPLLLEVQGQRDFTLATNCAWTLRNRMAADGRNVSDTSLADAVGDACLALAVWRATGDAVPMRDDTRGNGRKSKPINYAAVIAWRAIVGSFANDELGDTVPLYRMDPEDYAGEQVPSADWLFVSALSLPGGETALERRQRWEIERARAGRETLLDGRASFLASLGKGQGGARGKRKASVAKLHKAALLLLHGQTVDQAAMGAGFKADSANRKRAGERLGQAISRLGLPLGLVSQRTARATAFNPSPVHRLVDYSTTWPESIQPLPIPDLRMPALVPFAPGLDVVESVGIVASVQPEHASGFPFVGPYHLGNPDAGRTCAKRRERRAWIAYRRFEIACADRLRLEDRSWVQKARIRRHLVKVGLRLPLPKVSLPRRRSAKQRKASALAWESLQCDWISRLVTGETQLAFRHGQVARLAYRLSLQPGQVAKIVAKFDDWRLRRALRIS